MNDHHFQLFNFSCTAEIQVNFITKITIAFDEIFS